MDDAVLKDRVLEELDWDRAIEAEHIGVAVTDGAVTLSGHVESYPEKFAAVEAAKRVSGVKVVADEIKVHLKTQHRLDDTSIAERIAHVMAWNVSIPEDRVKATVRNGFVSLSGEVDWQHQRQHIEKQVRHIAGVVGVSNAITIKSRVTTNDVKDEIEEALRRHAELEADKVHIEVSGDTVTLSGRVKAYFERDLVENAAWSAPGVRNVIDRIAIG